MSLWALLLAISAFLVCLALQDTVPAENSVISMLMKANNKATGTPFNHM